MGFRKVTNPRTARIEIRLTPEEEERIMHNAHMCCITVSDYMRKCALEKNIEARFDHYVIGELSAIAKNLGELRNAVRDRPDLECEEEIFRQACAEIIRAMERLI
ncbi:hypothetical protein RI103_39420 (plasmid) [Paraburkholderia sp. FT54]|uniref:plasmid mobilization protein n=1 Tax=Paraburkholderia sp. FT54 TaxID=3074437 RepID=UPI0028776B12|nr:hypothetical protein [Paraburkholderia sp. FT54]WNC95564.1 hypothetical protein RI103_39420 [Paraburkholderia sp. FT54]